MATFQKYHAIKLSFINKNLLKTCFDHNSALSARTQPSFCTFDVLTLLFPKKHQFLNKTNEKLKKNYRAEPPPRGLENSNSLRKTKKEESLNISQIMFRPSKRRQRKKEKMNRVLLFKLLRMVLW